MLPSRRDPEPVVGRRHDMDFADGVFVASNRMCSQNPWSYPIPEMRSDQSMTIFNASLEY